MIVTGTTLVTGTASGKPLHLAEPLSFWGGFDAVTGRVIDRRHPDHGVALTGRIVIVRAARGSSSGSSVLAEAIRAGTAPAAFIIAERDGILTVGAMVASELYDRHCPIVVTALADLARLASAASITVTADATGARIDAQI